MVCLKSLPWKYICDSFSDQKHQKNFHFSSTFSFFQHTLPQCRSSFFVQHSWWKVSTSSRISIFLSITNDALKPYTCLFFKVLRLSAHSTVLYPQPSNSVHIRFEHRLSYFFRVLCFSAYSTVFASTYKPFLRLTLFIYFIAWFSESAFSPKCKYSSSVVGTQ